MDGSVKYKEEEVVCEVCSSTNVKTIWEKKPWSKAFLIKQDNQHFHMTDDYCKNCGLIYKNPMLTEDSQRAFYQSGHYSRLFKPGHQETISKGMLVEGVMRATKILDFLRLSDIPVKGKRIFEVGVGTAMLGKGLKSLGADFTGIDSDARNCEIAKKLFGFDVPHADFNQYDTNEKYDIIFCNSTIEHMYSPRQTLLRMKNMLHDDGGIFIEVPSYWFPYLHQIIDAFLSSAHNYTFSRDSFIKLARQCGLEVERFDYSGHHKCMHFFLTKNKPTEIDYNPAEYEEVLDRLEEYDRAVGAFNALSKELSPTSDVNTIIKELRSKMPNTSNMGLFVLAPQLLQAGKNTDVIRLLDQFKGDQSADIERSYATALHFQGIAYRQMGDFLKAKELFEKAREEYPQIGLYNFVQELKADGLLSEAVFSPLVWWNNEKALHELI